MKSFRMIAVCAAIVFSLNIPSTLFAKSKVPEPVVTQSQNSKLDFNSASAGDLSHFIKEIGKKRAQAIIAYRNEHGAFRSFKDLALVKGISKGYVSNWLSQLQGKFFIKSLAAQSSKS